MKKKVSNNLNIVSHADLLQKQFQGESARKREKPTGIPAYQMWHSRIKATLRWRESHWNGDENWKRAYKLYGGKHWRYQDEDNPSADEVRDFITVNITMSMVNNMVPFLVNANPAFILKPRKPGDVVSALIQQELLNYEFQSDEWAMVAQIKEAHLDAAIIGHGIIKTGFTFEVDQAISRQSGEIVYDDFIKEERPYLYRVDPFCFFYDPTASDRTLRTARWAGEIFYKHEDDVIDNESYSQKVRNKIKSGEYNPKVLDVNEEFGLSFGGDNLSIYDDITEYTPRIFKLFEIWDKKYRKYFVFCDGVDEPLVEKDWPYPYLRGFPYRRLDFIKIPNAHYPVGIPYSIEDQQFELDRTRTSMFQHRRRFNRKYRVSDKLDEQERQKLVDGDDGTIIITPPDAFIEPINDASIPQDQWAIEQVIKQDILELSGMDALMRGGALPSRTTGTEIQTRANVFRMKIDDLVDRSDKFVLGISGDILAHIKANIIRERVVKIVGQQGEFWVNATPEDIQAEVDVSMESIAAPKTDPNTDKQQALQLLQIVLQAVQAAAQMQQPLQINFNELFAWVIEKFGYKDVGRFFQRALQPNPPLQEQGSNNLNQSPSIVPSLTGQTPGQPMSPTDLQRQFGTAAIQNAGGLQ